jgi:5-methylcytosine-specific restriction protein A
MPTAPLKPCRFPGCRELTAVGHCEAHKAHVFRQSVAPSNAAQGLARRIRSSSAWRNAVRVFAAMHPLCCDPYHEHGDTHPEMGAHTHHVVALVIRPELAYDPANLRRLCVRCHSRVESAERRGIATRWLFASDGAGIRPRRDQSHTRQSVPRCNTSRHLIPRCNTPC